MSYIKDVVISAKDSTSVDAFGRWRISSPHTLFDSKQIFDNAPLFWDDAETSGSGTSSSSSTATASTTISVSSSTAGTRVRQTFMRFNYQPGKSQLVLMTTKMSTPSNGITGRVGYFDDDNGLYFEADDTDLYVVRRTKTSGSVVNNRVISSSWNVDPMDGTGPSGVTIDPSKTQILWIDFEWLGVGRVRMGFVVDGIFYVCHEFLNANNLTEVYMSTPNLPVRYEISNDGTGAAASLTHICSSVISEGGLEANGPIFSTSLEDDVINANTVGTTYALIGIRLKSTHIGATVKLISQSILATTSDNFLWEVRFNPTVAGTFTYSDLSNSAIQIAKGDVTSNPSTNTVTGGQIIQSAYGSGGGAEKSSVTSARHLGAAIDGTRDEIVLCVTPLTSNMDVTGAITWRELL